MNHDTTSTDTTSTGSAVTITEIAEFLQQLRALSRPGANPTRDAGDATPDVKAERAAFLARKADLFARIAAQHPGLIPPSPTHGDST
jgi:predicted methyltransferase